ncbi:MAG: PilZ domain-containing protein [Spirochaetes bacterium]|nr:PilZ domain-containing protein [Spirochaetota bacterium]
MSFTEAQRKKPRFLINIEGSYFYHENWEQCYVIDINLDGAGLNTNHNFQNNEIIQLKIILNSEEIILNCEVMNSKNFKTGVKFNDINPEQIIFIKKIINAKTDRFKI